jgi:osmoprotectant transport system substrate-binding protein
LRPAKSFLVPDQIFEVNKVDLNAINVDRLFQLETRNEINTFATRGNVDSDWRITELNELVRGQEIALGQSAFGEPKFVERRFYLGGTYIAHQGILAGRIDIYPEYTGTALTAVLKQPATSNPKAVYDRVKSEYESRFHLTLGPAFGFNDTFAVEIRGDDARRLHLQTISQSAQYTPQWRAGFGYEFMERPDGYKGLVATYGLRFAAPPRIMDLGLLTRALKEHQVDFVAGNMTDGLIPALDLFVLADDKHYFPPYEAVPVIREQTLAEHPEIGPALNALEGKISDEEMRQLNYEVDGKKRDVKEVVRDFLRSQGLN